MSDIPLIELTIQVVVAVAAVMITGLLLVRAITSAAKRAGVHQTQVRFFRDVMRAVFILLAILVAIHLSGLTSEFTALTVSGIAAVAISLALQTTLTNVISGILLLVDGSVHVGDSIEYYSVKGKVVRIGLRNTWIKTHKDELVIISNSQLSSGPFMNHTAGPRLLGRL